MRGAGFGRGRPLVVRTYDVPKNLVVDELVPAIMGLVEPTSWQTGGAGGSVHAVGQKLLIRQTERAHNQIQELLDALSPRLPQRKGGMFSP